MHAEDGEFLWEADPMLPIIKDSWPGFIGLVFKQPSIFFRLLVVRYRTAEKGVWFSFFIRFLNLSNLP